MILEQTATFEPQDDADDQPPLPRQRRLAPRYDRDPETPRLPPDAWQVELTAHDVLGSIGAHHREVISLLGRARSAVAIATATLTSDGVDGLSEALVDTCRRGARVDVLWGRDEGKGLERLKRLQYDASLGKAIGFNQSPAPTAMSVVVADVEGGTGGAAVVGSGPLARDSARSGDVTLAIRLRHPGLASAVCLAIAGAWQVAEGERLASGPDRVQRLAADLSAYDEGAEERGAVRARVILDRDHESLLSHGLAAAQRRVVLATATPTSIGPMRLMALLSSERSQDFRAAVVLGSTGADPGVARQLRTLLGAVGGQTVERPGHSRAAVIDDLAVVGSFDPLGTESYSGSRGVRHLSVELEGLETADTVERVLGVAGS
jgi:hypothetical protein